MVNWSTSRIFSLFILICTTGLLAISPAKERPVSTTSIWGFFGHKKINRMAVFTLPPELFGFYKEHIEYITEHAVDPDKRRYAVEGEAPRHYIDIDHYAVEGEDPFEIVPRYWKHAVEKYSEDTLQSYGIVPWYIEVMVNKLTVAFKNKNVDLILKYSADLGHYVGDAHVPLHTTKNYNGQLTNQRGIHGLWESRLPELLSDNYDYFVGKAVYHKDVNAFAWEAVYGSHMAVDSVLRMEKELTFEMSTDAKYSFETRGTSTVRTYSKDFSVEYHTRMNGMVERRFRLAIIGVGSMWYTAWVNAGQPDLNELMHIKPSEELLKEQEQLDLDVQSGKAKGRVCDH